MGNTSLLLGTVEFRDFEVPERVSWGGRQRLSVHRLPGGGRVIDALGRDDADISWSGVFTGEDATARVRQMDLMRISGAAWPLTWDWFYYTVVISKFEVEYQSQNWIPYRVVCTVVRDEVDPILETAVGLAIQISGDLLAAAGFETDVDLSAATGAMSDADSVAPGSAAYLEATGAVDNVATAMDGQLAATGTAVAASRISSAYDMVSIDSATGLLAATAAARGYVLRARANLGEANG
ncbi:MAG: hypothetical protein P4K98_06290 [Bryobacteraceae bacterium]|nr:hypothetical protein [Bryobacteraceae bacterium]